METNKKLKLDLQMFADADTGADKAGADKGESGGDDTGADKGAADKGAADKDGKKFTQAELNAAVEARIARERKETAQKIKDAVTEAQRMAKMSAEERAQHDREESEKALKIREQELTKRELRAQALELLGEKGLPKELADILPYVDADSTLASLTAVEKVFRAAVEKGVADRIKGTPPPSGQKGTTKTEREKLIAQYNEAEKKHDVLTMLTLESKIKKLPKE